MEELKKEIEMHLAGFAERDKDREDMRNEWRSLKSWAFALIIGSLLAFVSYGMWVGNINAQTMSNTKMIEQAQLRIDSTDKRQQASDITSAEIRTKLINIEATLAEIKQSQSDLNRVLKSIR